jgi:hypothetical protein
LSTAVISYPTQNRIARKEKKSNKEIKLTLSRRGFLLQIQIVSRVIISNEPVHE